MSCTELYPVSRSPRDTLTFRESDEWAWGWGALPPSTVIPAWLTCSLWRSRIKKSYLGAPAIKIQGAFVSDSLCSQPEIGRQVKVTGVTNCRALRGEKKLYRGGNCRPVSSTDNSQPLISLLGFMVANIHNSCVIMQAVGASAGPSSSLNNKQRDVNPHSNKKRETIFQFNPIQVD